MYPYAIGLDIGITSVGWSVLAIDHNEQPCGIIDLGVRIFDAAEHPKNGASLAAPRRDARSARRRLRRHRHRNERIRNLITDKLLSSEELAVLYDGDLADIYGLRVKALDEPVSRAEFARILIHLSQRRGFRSNRKNAKNEEDGKILAAVSSNALRMSEHGYRTVGEMFFKDPAFAEHKRNVGGDYISTVSRDMVQAEAEKIFASQRAFKVPFADEEFETEYLRILLNQRSFDEGPGGNSKYRGNQIDRMIGHCTFYPQEQRAAKATYSFEYYNLLEKINHIRLTNGKETVPLNNSQRDTLIALSHKSESLNYSQIRKALSVPADYMFNMVHYTNVKPEEAEKKEKFSFLKSYHQMRKAFEAVSKGSFSGVSHEQLDSIGTILTKYKNDKTIEQALLDAGITAEFIPKLQELSFSKFGHISIKACKAILPYLEKGMNYNDACSAAGFDFRSHSNTDKSMLLHYRSEDFEDITNPVVLRAVSQTIKVVNAIIRKQGQSPVYINIELAREMSKDFSERKKIEKEQKENASYNDRLIQEIRENFNINSPSGQDIVKYRLYKEQDGICAYSLRHIALNRLFEPNYAEIDHIIPYSISFDDSRKNKVLVLSEENRNKGNRIPLQYLSGKRRDDFIVWTKENVRDFRKRDLLLKETVDEAGFKERNLQDTKYITSFLQNYLRDNLLFAPSEKGRKKRVTSVNGSVTAYLRKRWGISKIREDGDLHHAADAVVIGCTTEGMIQKISGFSRYREIRYAQADSGSYAVDERTGEIIGHFPLPWDCFRKELEARLGNDPARILKDLNLPFYLDDDAPEIRPVFVSRMPKRKVTGAAHKDTVKSAKELCNGLAVLKRPLTDLKLENGEIKNYCNPEDDPILYNALVNQLKKYNGDAKAAFTEPFHKPKLDGTPGPVVKTVKLTEPTTLNVAVHKGKGIADNGSMVRIDIYKVENDGYYFVPIYVADTLKKDLPRRACVAHKPYSEWKEMDEKDFQFSLFPNDMVQVTHKKTLNLNLVNPDSNLQKTVSTDTAYMYYISADISTGSINLINHDNCYKIKGLGIKSLKSMEKYDVSILGEYHPVKKETLRKFT